MALKIVSGGQTDRDFSKLHRGEVILYLTSRRQCNTEPPLFPLIAFIRNMPCPHCDARLRQAALVCLHARLPCYWWPNQETQLFQAHRAKQTRGHTNRKPRVLNFSQVKAKTNDEERAHRTIPWEFSCGMQVFVMCFGNLPGIGVGFLFFFKLLETKHRQGFELKEKAWADLCDTLLSTGGNNYECRLPRRERRACGWMGGCNDRLQLCTLIPVSDCDLGFKQTNQTTIRGPLSAFRYLIVSAGLVHNGTVNTRCLLCCVRPVFCHCSTPPRNKCVKSIK